jgi:cell wall-associated NlpC family hydrolase
LGHLVRNHLNVCQGRIKEFWLEFDRIMEQSDRDVFLDYAWRFVKTPYLWGGDDPMAGFDCSGFVIECMKAVDLLPHKGDWTAHALWILFKNKQVQKPGPGCLVFWQSRRGDDKKMNHVEIVVHPGLSLGASGGGSKVDNLQMAILKDAYIKMRPYRDRDSRALYFVDPFKEVEA